MATVSNTLYPPIVQTYMPAFPYNEKARIYFSLSKFDDMKQIEYIHVSLVDQRNNENMLSIMNKNYSQTISVAIYKVWNGDKNAAAGTSDRIVSSENCFVYDETTGLFYIDIYPSQLKTAKIIGDDIKGSFNINQYYKVQLRFDTGEGIPNLDEENKCVWVLDQSRTPKEGGRYNEYALQNIDSFTKHLNTYLSENTQNFSEWSTVCLIRPIAIPKIMLQKSFGKNVEGQTKLNSDATAANFNLGDMWVYGAVQYFDEDGIESNIETDHLDRYTFHLLKKDGTLIGSSKTYYTSDKQAKNSINEINELISLQDYEVIESEKDDTTFVLQIEAVTSNGYTIPGKYFPFSIGNWNRGPQIKTWILEDNENGRVQVCAEVIATQEMLDGLSPSETQANRKYDDLSGHIIIRRTSDHSNFKKWDLVKKIKLQPNKWRKIDNNHYTLAMSEEDAKDLKKDAYIWFIDNTLGSMNWYEYSFQVVNRNGFPSEPVKTGKYHSEFEYPILVRDKTQLAIKYDFNISSYKPVVSRNKIDTLGGKYPKFVENAVLGYKQFSISGKISSQEDEYQLFIRKRAWDEINSNSYNYKNYEFGFAEEAYDDYYLKSYESTLDEKQNIHKKAFYKEEKDESGNVIYDENERPKLVLDGYDMDDSKTSEDCYFHHDNWLEYHDWLWERKFREAAIKWLNDGEPKLMKTLTEGNVCVMLTDINLTPEKTLGRRLYNFTATAYEVGDGYGLETLDSLGIYPVIDETLIDFEKLAGEVNNIEEDDLDADPEIGQQINFSIKDQTWWWDDENPQLDIVKYIYDLEQYERKNCQPTIRSGSLYLTDVKVQFRNQPHLYKRNNGEWELINTNDNFLPEDVEFIGYRIEVRLKDNSEWTTIMVNRKGYYQFVSDLEIAEMKFPEMQIEYGNPTSTDVIDIDYVKRMSIGSDLSRIYSKSTVLGKIVGQERNTFSTGEQIQNNIYNKHYFKNFSKKTVQYLDYWKGLSIDTEPHAVLFIRYFDEEFKVKENWAWAGRKDYQEDILKNGDYFEIGETGYFNLFDKNSAVYDMQFVGKKMYRSFENGYRDSYNNEYIENIIPEDWESNAAAGIVGSNETHYDSYKYMREHEYYRHSEVYNSFEEMVETLNSSEENPPMQQHVYSAYVMNPFTFETKLISYIYYNKNWYIFLDDVTEQSLIDINNNLLRWRSAEAPSQTPSEEFTIGELIGVNFDNEWMSVRSLLTIRTQMAESNADIGIALIPIDAIINYTGTLVEYSL